LGGLFSLFSVYAESYMITKLSPTLSISWLYRNTSILLLTLCREAVQPFNVPPYDIPIFNPTTYLSLMTWKSKG
jgi:hypothetical protein